MGKRKGQASRQRGRREQGGAVTTGFLISQDAYDTLCIPGYTSLDRSPEVLTACRKIAELIGMITIHLMSNEASGDVRIVNELSRKIDIDPMPTMTRKTWIESIVMNLLLYGRGNAVVWPHTHDGLLMSLEPVSMERVQFQPIGYRDYKILIDGVAHNPEDMLHFVLNPDKLYLWRGNGVQVSLREIADSLRQAAATKKGFMESKWKPSLIVKVDALSKEFATQTGRRRLYEEYLKTSEVGEPWIIPAGQIAVEQVRPLSLGDLAISDAVEVDKRTVAAVLGVPPFVVGVGNYSQQEWNNFVQTTVRGICQGIAQEMTKKLIFSPSWYLKFNTLSLMDWDLQTIANVFGSLSDRGIVTGNEVRDRIGMSPADGLDEHRILENYLPYDMSGKQKKLVQGEE